jgi:hypothetical protein
MTKATPKSGAPRGNRNALKPEAERGVLVTVRLTAEQVNGLKRLGGTTKGLRSLMDIVAALPVLEHPDDDYVWRFVKGHDFLLGLHEERERAKLKRG